MSVEYRTRMKNAFKIPSNLGFEIFAGFRVRSAEMVSLTILSTQEMLSIRMMFSNI